MGVDCKIYLPPQVRINDVADVLAILTGATPRREELTDDAWCTRVDGVHLVNCGASPQCVNIEWRNGDGFVERVLYHFEFGNDGERGIILRSGPRNIALLRRLADFFGGTVDYRDCDSNDAAYQRPLQPDANAEDGELWESLQRRKLNIVPITQDDIAECDKFSAYHNK